jgi:hypothetical protein
MKSEMRQQPSSLSHGIIQFLKPLGPFGGATAPLGDPNMLFLCLVQRPG